MIRSARRLPRVGVATLAAVLAVGLAPAVAPPAAAGTGGPDEATTVVAVDVDALASDAQVEELTEALSDIADQAGGTVRVASEKSSLVSVEVPVSEASEVADELAEQAASGQVAVPAEFSLARTPRDPRFDAQRPYLRPLGLPRGWKLSRGSSDVTIAVVDSGVATDHPDLRSKIAGRHNAVTGNRAVADRNGHGTAVASVAAAATSNERGIAGLGWRTSILAVKVEDRAGRIWGDAVAAGIRWAVRRGADVINLSLGSPQDDPFVRRAVAYAVDNNVVVVAAVSNQGSTDPTYPAAYSGVLAVGATDASGLAPFSDRGAVVDVAAPGVGIVAAVPGGYRRVAGTSFAAALVSGQASLICAEKPRMRAGRVAAVIERTTRAVGSGDALASQVHVYDSLVRARGVPTKPRELEVAARTRSALVSWRPPAEDGRAPVTAYRVTVKRRDAPGRVSVTVAGSRRKVAVTGLSTRSRYVARVAAVNRLGVGAPNRSTFRTR